ncbi:MAG: aldehyde dehydrogenase family protein, partial [Pseudomonadota bacterium]|nr:aldehyde dehydrogenase family protein [Pseudomonadota bacterium]
MSGPIKTINPATDEPLAEYALMSNDQVDAAVEACHQAFLDWRLKSLDDRAAVIRAIGQELRDSKDEFAKLMSQEVGKLISASGDEIELCAAICDFTADNGPEELADEEREIPGGTGVVTYSPLGVIYGIQPWNFPCYQAVRYAIANLMAGNGVLLKHAANCTGSGLFLRDLFKRAGLPENLFTVLIIDHDQSDA